MNHEAATAVATAPAVNPAQFDPELWCLFDQYVYGDIDRRSFLDRAARFALAQKVAPGDARVQAEQVGPIKAELLISFAENDERINAAWPAYEAALKSAGTKHEAFKSAGTQHGFNNDTTPRFAASAAQQAWARTLALFNRTWR